MRSGVPGRRIEKKCKNREKGRKIIIENKKRKRKKRRGKRKGGKKREVIRQRWEE